MSSKTHCFECFTGWVSRPGTAIKVLDLGCGTGDSSIYLAQHGWKVTGVDYVPQALDKAQAKTAAPVDFVRADVTGRDGTTIHLHLDDAVHRKRAGIGPGADAGEVLPP